MNSYMERAAELHVPGANHKNCCQSVLGALGPSVGMEEETALKVGSCFGAGMMRGEVCGALSAALMYIGLKYGNDAVAKAKGREFQSRFEDTFGSILCRDIVNPQTGRKDCMSLVVKVVEMLTENEQE